MGHLREVVTVHSDDGNTIDVTLNDGTRLQFSRPLVETYDPRKILETYDLPRLAAKLAKDEYEVEFTVHEASSCAIALHKEFKRYMKNMGYDNTPIWAYDEDGYCVCCGNGRWKFHMPECELRDALDIVRGLAASEDTAGPDDDGFPIACHFCGAEPPELDVDDVGNTRYGPMPVEDHSEFCLWRRARESQKKSIKPPPRR